VGQNFVPFAYLDLERSISHTLDNGSVDRNHIFFWNDITSFLYGLNLEAQADWLSNKLIARRSAPAE
jgi:hypothetical protein